MFVPIIQKKFDIFLQYKFCLILIGKRLRRRKGRRKTTIDDIPNRVAPQSIDKKSETPSIEKTDVLKTKVAI